MKPQTKPGLIYFAGYPHFHDRNQRCASLPATRKVEASVALWEVWPEERKVDWSSIEQIRGPWNDQGKKVDIRIMTAHNRVFFSPEWLYDNRGVALVAAGFFEDFEGSSCGWIPSGNNVRVICTPGSVLAGDYSVLLNAEQGPASLRTREWKPQVGEEYLVQVNYNVLKTGVLSFGSGSTSIHQWNLVAGTTGLLQLRFIAQESDRNYFTFESGNIVLDNIGIHQISNTGFSVAGFPDYFSPGFHEHWNWFLEALAEKYAKDPGIEDISISGLGRWEEMILDDDVAGRLTPQWKARGFTNESYLNRIVQLMDQHRLLFPEKPLKQQIAFGLHVGADMGYLYHRAAEAAEARGIGIKQNGLSERYDTWENNEDAFASWVYNHYKYNKNMVITHETGAQIYNNGADATGHPLSLINRGIMNAIDYLFLYDMDILEPNIIRYFPYLNAMCTQAPITRYYCMAGSYTFENEFTTGTVDYKNQWIALRQNQPPAYGVDHYVFTPGPQAFLTQPRQYYLRDGQAQYGVLDGVPFMETTQGSDCLFFDVDERLLFHGITGTRLEFMHFETQGRFLVYYWDCLAENFIQCGTLGGGNSRSWQRTSIELGNHLSSSRNNGEDRHVNIVLLWVPQEEDITGKLSWVTMDCVPLRDYVKEVQDTIQDISQEKSFVTIPMGNKLNGGLQVPQNQLYAGFSLTFHSPSQKENPLNIRVFQEENQGEWSLCYSKTHSWIPDNHKLDLFLVMLPGTRYRWEIEAQQHHCFVDSENGYEPFIEPVQFRTETRSLDQTVQLHKYYRVEKPIIGITGLQETGTIRIESVHATKGSPLVQREVKEWDTEYFSPLPPGDYLIDAPSGCALVLLNSRTQAASPDNPCSPLREDLWNSRWSVTRSAKEVGKSESPYHLDQRRIAGLHPEQGPKAIRFRTKNSSSRNLLTLWWSTALGQRGCVHVPLVPFDHHEREYEFDLRGEVPDSWITLELCDSFGTELLQHEISNLEVL